MATSFSGPSTGIRTIIFKKLMMFCSFNLRALLKNWTDCDYPFDINLLGWKHASIQPSQWPIRHWTITQPFSSFLKSQALRVGANGTIFRVNLNLRHGRSKHVGKKWNGSQVVTYNEIVKKKTHLELLIDIRNCVCDCMQTYIFRNTYKEYPYVPPHYCDYRIINMHKLLVYICISLWRLSPARSMWRCQRSYMV